MESLGETTDELLFDIAGADEYALPIRVQRLVDHLMRLAPGSGLSCALVRLGEALGAETAYDRGHDAGWKAALAAKAEDEAESATVGDLPAPAIWLVPAGK